MPKRKGDFDAWRAEKLADPINAANYPEAWAAMSDEQWCIYCGPKCYGGAEHNARYEDDVLYGTLPGETVKPEPPGEKVQQPAFFDMPELPPTGAYAEPPQTTVCHCGKSPDGHYTLGGVKFCDRDCTVRYVPMSQPQATVPDDLAKIEAMSEEELDVELRKYGVDPEEMVQNAFQKVCVLAVSLREHLRAAEQDVQYANARYDKLWDEAETIRIERDRLKEQLSQANAGFEEYERKFYLTQDRAEVAEAAVAELQDELAAMTEDRDLWQGDHNEDCPNEAKVAELKERK